MLDGLMINNFLDTYMFEIRTYHISVDHITDYKVWAKKYAVPYLKEKLFVVGFWVDSEHSPEVLGGVLDPLGSSNVTYILRWKDLEQRNNKMDKIFSSPEWQEISSHLQGGVDIYLRREFRFVDAL